MSTTTQAGCPLCGAGLTRLSGLAEGHYTLHMACYALAGDRGHLARLAGVVALTCNRCEYCTTEPQRRGTR